MNSTFTEYRDGMTHEQLFADSPVKIGTSYRFNYPVEFTTLDDYSAHRGQIVTVLRPCAENEADIIVDRIDANGPDIVMDRMFLVRAQDGWTGHAWESELLTSFED